MKQGLATALKAVAGLAGTVALLAPITDTGLVITGMALLVAIIAGVIGIHLSDDDDDQRGGYWPQDPNSSWLKIGWQDQHPTRFPEFAGECARPTRTNYFLGLSSFRISATMLSMTSLMRLSGRLKLFDRMENATTWP